MVINILDESFASTFRYEEWENYADVGNEESDETMAFWGHFSRAK
jgi:hypothetical protein